MAKSTLNPTDRYFPVYEGFIPSQKKQLAIQLQYGEPNSPMELVMAGQFLTDEGEWAFAKHSQVRILADVSKIDSMIETLQNAKKALIKAKKVVSPVTSSTVNIEELTVEQLTTILASKQAAKVANEKSEVILTQSKTRRTRK